MKEVQRSFDPSILEGQVTAEVDIQSCWVTGSNQPEPDIALVGLSDSSWSRPAGNSQRLNCQNPV